MPKADSPRRLTTFALALAVAAAYYLAARLGFVLRFPPATTSVLWPPNSLLTAILLLTPPRRWWICLGAVLPVHAFVEVQAGFPTSLVLALFVTNCSEALIAAALMHRWSDAPGRFDSLRRITAFLAAAVLLAPFLSSFLDAGVVHVLRGEAYWPVFSRRFFSNALSALTIVPSIATLAGQGLRWLRESSSGQRLEAAALTGVLVAIALAVFSSRPEHPSGLPGAPYTSLAFLIPVLMWAAVRFGPGGTSLTLLATSLLAIRAATLGWKPFSPLTPEESVVALQVFVTVVGIPLLYLSALIEERRQTTAELGERLRFEELLSKLSAEFVHLPSHEMDRAFEISLQQLGQLFEVDRVTLRRFSGNDGALKVAYTWEGRHAPAAPAVLERSDIPWSSGRLLREEPIVVSSLDDLPPEAARERDYLHAHGVRSLLVLPLVVGKRVLGGLGFVATLAPRAWPAMVVERSRLIADMFASAMARKQAEDALRASEAAKTAILASLSSYVAVLDRAGRIATVNERWNRLAIEGPDGGEGLGEVGSDHLGFWRRLAAAGMREAATAVAGIEGVLEGSRPSFVLQYACHADPDTWYVMTVVPLLAPEGGAVLSLSDVTERKRAELEAQKSRQELAHFLRVSTIGELTTSLAHELNQPLTAILANAQAASRLLKDSPYPGSDQIREMLTDIAAEDQRAGEIIRRLRELLRKGEPQLALLDVNAMVREVVDLLANDALLRGVSLRLELQPGGLRVRVDRVQMQQVLLNVLINAMEAITEERGTDAVVLVRTQGAGDRSVRISVADTGPGLRTTAAGGVFEPFYTTKPHGLGMGLSIARSIAEAHGGAIAASNNPTRGATFNITLPAAEPES